VDTPDVVVAGAGVSSATLAYEAARRGFSVEVIDVARRYSKACGDAVTIRDETLRIVRETDSEITKVKRFLIAVDGEVIEEFTLGAPAWLIVDKAGMVMRLRELAEAEGARIRHGHWRGERGSLATVDARGPYARPYRESVLLYRAISPAEWPSDTALLDFAVHERGVYWIFPASGDGMLVNVGAGFEGIRDAGEIKRRVSGYLAKWTGAPLAPRDERGAPMQLFAPVQLSRGRVYAVGEAAGILLRTGGEGNRPGMLSAIAFAQALSEASELSELEKLYRERVSRLLDEVETSLAILKIVSSARPQTASELLNSLPSWFWRDFVRARVYKSTVLKIAATTPGAGLSLLKALLDKLRKLPY